ncbi:ribbon-helix-helix domain-containing protein [Nostoc sp. FACHB-888]|uniref:ribbon-helix-helix domain-containing protein n=1 Tax=Nostoc sp. FACHB-888 TaxID=2692842 RepID=UPI0016844627|nr:ribbon-helix-helix domain-containing protein [Nostoc sp. FACHB-888]MBD2249476.1 hypothetical protein [Nostoc sp. FACHB-888]
MRCTLFTLKRDRGIEELTKGWVKGWHEPSFLLIRISLKRKTVSITYFSTPSPTIHKLQKHDKSIGGRGAEAIAGHFDPAVSKQLKQLALEQDATVQALLAEALNDLFEKYGKKPIA